MWNEMILLRMAFLKLELLKPYRLTYLQCKHSYYGLLTMCVIILYLIGSDMKHEIIFVIIHYVQYGGW